MNHPHCRGWLSMWGAFFLSKCQKGLDGKRPLEGLHGKRPTQEFVLLGEKVLAKQVSQIP